MSTFDVVCETEVFAGFRLPRVAGKAVMTAALTVIPSRMN
jgi:hypothetical protein